jgi:hypothetical protein
MDMFDALATSDDIIKPDVRAVRNAEQRAALFLFRS